MQNWRIVLVTSAKLLRYGEGASLTPRLALRWAAREECTKTDTPGKTFLLSAAYDQLGSHLQQHINALHLTKFCWASLTNKFFLRGLRFRRLSRPLFPCSPVGPAPTNGILLPFLNYWTDLHEILCVNLDGHCTQSY